MTTIAGQHPVLFVAGGERPHNRSFRAIGKMGVTAHGSGMFEEGALDVLFEFANPRHLDINPDQPVFPKLVLVWHRITPFPQGLGRPAGRFDIKVRPLEPGRFLRQ
jgi:hypothetical protein